MGEARATPEGKYFLPQFHQRLPCIPGAAFPTAAPKEKQFQRIGYLKQTKNFMLHFFVLACKWLFSPAFPEVCCRHVVPAIMSDLPGQNSCHSLKAPGWHQSCLAIAQRQFKDLKAVMTEESARESTSLQPDPKEK